MLSALIILSGNLDRYRHLCGAATSKAVRWRGLWMPSTMQNVVVMDPLQLIIPVGLHRFPMTGAMEKMTKRSRMLMQALTLSQSQRVEENG